MKNLLFIVLGMLITITNSAQNVQSYLGVTSNILNVHKAEKLDLEQPYGAYITSVTKGTAADKAGLKPFDYITAIGDVMLNQDNDLGDVLSNFNPGNLTKITYIRQGKVQITNTVLGDRKDIKHESRPDEDDPLLGVHEGHKNTDIKGVAVNVSRSSTADYIGMENGDIIKKIDKYPIIDWHDLTAAIDARNPGDDIVVTVVRNGQEKIFSGRIKSEAHDSPLDKAIDMENMRIELNNMEEAEMEMVEEITEEKIFEAPALMVENLNLFPNPNIGQFTLTFDVENEGDVFVMVLSAQGKLIFEEQLPEFSGNFNKGFDLGSNPPGVYFLMVRQGNKVMTRKVIVTSN